MRTRITITRAHLLGAALAAALALPRAAAGQDTVAPQPPRQESAPPAAPVVTDPAPPTMAPSPPAATSPQTGSDVPASATGPGGTRQGGAARTGGGSGARERPRPAPTISATATEAAGTASSTTASADSAAPPGSVAGPAAASFGTDTGTVPAAGAAAADSSLSRAGGELSWLAGTAVIAFALLLAGQVGVIVRLGRIGREMRIFGARLSILEKQMSMHPERAHSDQPSRPATDAPEHALLSAGEAENQLASIDGSSGGTAETQEPHGTDHGGVAVDDRGNGAGGEPDLPADGEESHQGGAGDHENGRMSVITEDEKAHPWDGGEGENAGGNATGLDQSDDGIRTPEPVPPPPPPPPVETWPGGSHELYLRARARLAELQEIEGGQDRARLAAAAARFERRKAWVLALHQAWENDVDYAYLDLLQKPGVGAVKDSYVMVYPLSEHDWKASRDALRRLAGHIGALPDEGAQHWPALLPQTAMRSSVDFDLRVQPPQGASLAAEFHARRLLATLLVNLKALQGARVELSRLVQWVVQASPAAEARLADVSSHALAILDAVCAAGVPDGERQAAVDAAVAALDAVDAANFDAVRAAEDRAEKLEQHYRAFLKKLLRAVDGTDRARALHAEAMANGGAGDPWLAGWGSILEGLDDLLVRRVLGGCLQIEPIDCEPGHPLDTDLHNPLGGEPVQGLQRDEVLRVENRGFAYTEDGARRVVRPVDVIAAVAA